jgi:ribosomal protein S27AE
MLGPLYAAAIAAALGRKRRCPVCAKQQFADRLDKQGRYHCKKCGHIFTIKELKKTS